MSLLVEKYRPHFRNELVGNKNTLDSLFNMVNSGNLTHCILEGPAGVGKTTTAHVIARQLFGEFYKNNFLELNASDERGIDVVRNQIKVFARTSPLNSTHKILLLDEADELTPEAQNALRRTIESYSNITKFIFSVNKLQKLIDPIQSRCEVFRFGPISVEDMIPRLAKIYCSEKGINVESKKRELEELGAFIKEVEGPVGLALRKVAEYSHGDMRKAINHLQLLLASGEELSEASVESIKPTDYGKLIFDSLQKGRLLEARKHLQASLELGYKEDYIIELIHNVFIDDMTLDINTKREAVFNLCETDYRLTLGVNAMLAMDNLLYKLLRN